MTRSAYALVAVMGAVACGAPPRAAVEPASPVAARPAPACRTQWRHLPEEVQFDVGSTEPRAGSDEVLAAVIERVAPLDDLVQLRVEGHAGPCPEERLRGDELAEARARRIASALAERGLEVRIERLAYGATRPRGTAGCPVSAGVASSRRVEFSIEACEGPSPF